MILLFGDKASKSRKNSNIKNHPIENSGILAHKNNTGAISLLAANEYDIYMFSQQAAIDYSQYGDDNTCEGGSTFISNYSLALSSLESSDSCGFSSMSSFSCDCSSSCSSFASIC